MHGHEAQQRLVLYLPLGVYDQIQQSQSELGGEASRPGIFGRRGAVLFMGRIAPKNMNSYIGQMRLVVEYWTPTRSTVDYDAVTRDVRAGGDAAGEVIAALRAAM